MEQIYDRKCYSGIPGIPEYDPSMHTQENLKEFSEAVKNYALEHYDSIMPKRELNRTIMTPEMLLDPEFIKTLPMTREFDFADSIKEITPVVYVSDKISIGGLSAERINRMIDMNIVRLVQDGKGEVCLNVDKIAMDKYQRELESCNNLDEVCNDRPILDFNEIGYVQHLSVSKSDRGASETWDSVNKRIEEKKC